VNGIGTCLCKFTRETSKSLDNWLLRFSKFVVSNRFDEVKIFTKFQLESFQVVIYDTVQRNSNVFGGADVLASGIESHKVRCAAVSLHSVVHELVLVQNIDGDLLAVEASDQVGGQAGGVVFQFLGGLHLFQVCG
jgi:hypothetical protein